MNLQQTPNPTAQFPSALPPLELHCDDVKHVPFVLEKKFKIQHLFFTEIKTKPSITTCRAGIIFESHN